MLRLILCYSNKDPKIKWNIKKNEIWGNENVCHGKTKVPKTKFMISNNWIFFFFCYLKETFISVYYIYGFGLWGYGA